MQTAKVDQKAAARERARAQLLAERDGHTLRTMVFDDEDEYVRFVNYVYDEFGGTGLELTNVPVRWSVRVSGTLLDATQEGFAMRPVSENDLAKARERVKNRRPWDPNTLDEFFGPPRK
jgi:hypothetical protein